MNFSRFFIDRPVFAAVIAILTCVVGAIALHSLPINQYPNITPPTITVNASYPGANPETVANTVAAPLEQEINGVDNMLFILSTCTSDGQMAMTVTFQPGTNSDTAQVLVQNRVAAALARLPDVVRQNGVVTRKRSPDFTLAVQLISPDKSKDDLYLSNFALLQLRDQLARVKGVGDVLFFGARDYSMRVWLNPDAIAARNMTAGDVLGALREQNAQIAAGSIGAQPAPEGLNFEFSLTTQGRLESEEEFKDIVIKTGENGEVVRLRDVARIELGAKDYRVISRVDGEPSTTIGIFQAPESNALDVSTQVRATLENMRDRFPPGVDYRIYYDTTIFVRESINAVVKTVFEAFILVVIVVLVFLQNWRATLIPIIAVPVSLIGTFAVMQLLGFSLNNLTLFGMVLAIGIVVDDAIVVVEAVEHHMAAGMKPRDATIKAMSEVSGPIIAISLVLASVFVPTAFIPGITGSFYKQFALTIAVSTILSAINSLTLSPALSAMFLQAPTEKKDWFGRLIDGLLGWFFKLFNRTFTASTNGYLRVVRGAIRGSFIVLLLYGGLLFLTGWSFNKVPTGFIPAMDQGYFFVNIELPEAASLERTDAVVRKVLKTLQDTPGVDHVIERVGSSLVSGATASNAGTLIAVLDPFDKRAHDPALSLDGILGSLRKNFSSVKEAQVLAFGPPSVRGLGNTSGVRMMVQDRGGGTPQALQKAVQAVTAGVKEHPAIDRAFSLYRANTPQIYLDINRLQAKVRGVAINSISEALQVYLGSAYVNDVTLFGRPYQVTAQADGQYRARPEDVLNLRTRNNQGQMVPLGSVVELKQSNAPSRVVRYNLFPAAELNGNAATGYSSGELIKEMEEMATKNLPPKYGFEWTDMALQEKIAGNSAALVFPICVLFVFLVLAAQYENWSLPLAIVLIVPLCILCALAGIAYTKGDNNIFTQIGFVVLIGLACKNAILIVEFAKLREDAGVRDPMEAAIEACKLRLRPILMTSFAFILGVVPLVHSSGAGSEMRRSLGVAVFSGMIGVTFFGILLTPVFFVVIRKVTRRFSKKPDVVVQAAEITHH